EEAPEERQAEEEEAGDRRDAHGPIALDIERQLPSQVVLRNERVVEDDLHGPGPREDGEDRAAGAGDRERELGADLLQVRLEVLVEARKAPPADVPKEQVLLQAHGGLRRWPGGASQWSRGRGPRCDPR